MRLNIAFSHNPRLQPLFDGSIQPEGIEVNWHVDHPTALFLQHVPIERLFAETTRNT